MWRSSLLKFNPVKVVVYLTNQIHFRFQYTSWKRLESVIKISSTCHQDLIKIHFSSQVKLFTSFWDKIFPLTDFERHINKGVHFVSAAEKEQNHVGMPRCLTMATTSFFACSKYGGDPLRFLKTRNPSSCFTKFSMKSDDKILHAVIFLPWVLHFRTAS